eukprot:CAMPEP_0184311000 /NCGR_PEP_ID=MMETSP1049-20130417/37570_1 /TAXON_ID=77928 /ORGANISM="Proteomonas sulcata, Strain CCMP704" /LENGTH=69 /DNA_ID=CAMNT_0026625943 /DNA_START=88 /DNA_END=297 /DNA_ORIENTATION=+
MVSQRTNQAFYFIHPTGTQSWTEETATGDEVSSVFNDFVKHSYVKSEHSAGYVAGVGGYSVGDGPINPP